MRNFLFVLSAVLPLAACVSVSGIQHGPAPESTSAQDARAAESPTATYNRDEVLNAAKTFFGGTSAGLAGAIERTFSDYGEPVAYIEGEEGSGAFFAGARYGQGYLQFKNGGRSPIFWQGPSVGWDFGGNASKVFTLIYNLRRTDQLYQRFPSVEGSVYVVAGVGLNYQRSGDVVLAPIRTGVGFRAGANIGYVHYTKEPSYLPF